MNRTKGSRFIAMLLAVIMVFSAIPMTALIANAATVSGNTTEFAGGSGTEDDPYLISTKEHLNNVRNYLDAHFKMINDIEFTDADFSDGGAFYNDGSGWDPINGFCGVFDGGCFSIRNLYINRSSNQVGLFGKIEYNTAQLKNIALIDCDITGGSWVGGIVGYIKTWNEKYVTFEKCHVSGSVTGNNEKVGGICGLYSFYIGNDSNYDITAFSQCYNSADVTGKNASVGGIVGCAISNECYADIYFSECVNTGTICGSNDVGGIVGYTNGYSSSVSNVWVSGACISNSYNTGRISATAEYGYAGGIVGRRYNGYLAIPQTYSIGTITGYYASKLVGGAKQTVSSHYYNYGYYSADDGYYDNWGYGKSDDELKNQSTYSGWDFDTVWTMGGDESYPYPELQCFVLKGSMAIAGTAEYDAVVSPDLTGIEKIDNTFTYTWYIDNTPVDNGGSYKIKAEDVGKKISLKVISTNPVNVGTLTSEPIVVAKADNPATLSVPELLSVDDCSFEFTTVSDQEYSIDNVNWQVAGRFENLDPNVNYTIYSRKIETVVYVGVSNAVLNITTDRRPLSGSISIVGTARYGDTLTADVSELLPTGATFSYEWRSSGTVVGTSKTYTITKNDIGKSIVLYVKGTKNYIGTISSPAIVATKTTVQLPNAPVVADKTNTSVTLVAKSGYEYSMDKVVWQNSPVFTGLSAATEYTFYQRAKETDTTFASKVSNGTKETTLKNTIAAPAKPVIETVTNTSVTLVAMDGYEYSMDGLTWQTSNVFRGLQPYTEYSFCQRITENKTDYASAQSGYTLVITLKNTVAAPGTPVVEKATATSVTLIDISGYEYSKDGATWQDNNVFTGLTTLETYTFYQRIKETGTDYTSATSAGTSFKVKYVADAPASPTLTEKTNNKIVVAVSTGCEYSINKTTWNVTGEFSGLQPNQTYAVYCRIPETDTHYASAVSNALTVTTLKNTVSAPSGPVLSSKTSNSVTLVSSSTYEYSKDGKTWQASNVFNSLSPNTEYTFYQRKAETNTSYASEKSAGLTVTTPKATVSAPSAPVLSAKTATSVTLVKTSGYEYSKDGNIWQSGNVFDGLKPNTQYSFYQRVAETNTAYASTASTALTTTTPKNEAGTANPVIAVRVTTTSVTLAPYTGYEYSKDGATWQTSNVFTGLTANTAYTFYQRIAETADTNASASSTVCNVTTSAKIACSVSPAAPIVAETTTSKVVLVAREGYEYSKNGTTWQTDNTFSGLSSNTSYTFYQRIAETSRELASAKSVGVTVSTYKLATGTTSATNYQKLYSYVQKNGKTSSGGIRYLPITMTFNGAEYKLELSLKENGIQFYITYYNNETVYTTTSFILQETSKNLIVKHYVGGTVSISTFPYYAIESAENNLTIDRSTYTSEKTYNLTNRGEYLTASQLTNLFNSQLTLSTMLYDKYLYDNLGFGLMGLGFTSFVGFGSTACDIPSSHHSGAMETRNAYSATCTTDGYTGDTYCVNCGEKASSGSVIACSGHHTYSNSCDKACNTCGEERAIEHQYSNVCDTTCNICNTTRAEIEHIFDNACDETCNVCYYTRVAPHNYSNACDPSCNSCGTTRSAPHTYTNVCDDSCNVCNYTRTAPHDYDGDCDTQCNVCGLERTVLAVHDYAEATCLTPATCRVCHKTRGTKLGHSFTHYVSNNDATYDADGTKTAKCDRCDVTDTVVDEGSKLIRNGWFADGGKWYYYVDDVMKTGWLQLGSTWYYMNAEGIMQTGWQQIGGTWYFFNTSGAMVTGWQQISGTWYYFKSGGAMVTGWLQVGSTWYYFKSSGAMATGWLQVGSTWYFFQSGGAMQTGWLKIGNLWYYFHSSGAMATSPVTLGGKTYRFDANGACLNP